MKGTNGRLCCMLGWRMKHWQVPVLFGGIRQIRAWADVFKKHFQKPFQNRCLAFLSSLSWLPVTTITPQNNKKKMYSLQTKQKRGRDSKRETKRNKDRGFTLLILWPHYFKAWLQETMGRNISKERRKRENEWQGHFYYCSWVRQLMFWTYLEMSLMLTSTVNTKFTLETLEDEKKIS